MFESRLLMFSGMFFFNAGGMITLLVDVQQFIVGFHVRFYSFRLEGPEMQPVPQKKIFYYL